ncbi:perlucin-like protein [Mytilus californianus]|uniref:perlucin-like protein n=1 Tax=Mytilus californianus TaxID=6549 RepID=UPI002247E259|nr:perlucin-like protein [Mytilus californianus]
MYLLTFVVILALATFDVFSLPCLSSKAKKEFETVRQKLKTLHADLGKKVLGLDTDLKSMETDLAKKQWRKYNGHCYYVGDDVKSWFDAERKCKHIGGHLVKIDDKPENNWLKSQLAASTYWIGLIDLKEGEFRWSYDQQLVKYKNYNKGEPNNHGGNEDCVTLLSSGKWNDNVCSNTFMYICENNFCY